DIAKAIEGMSLRYVRQLLEQAQPEPALPAFVDECRVGPADQPALPPIGEPVAPEGEIAIEAARHGAREREALARVELRDARAQGLAVRNVRHRGEGLEDHPARAFGLERRARRQVADHTLERLPDETAA